MQHVRDSSKNLQLLSELLLNSAPLPQSNGDAQATELRFGAVYQYVSALTARDLEDLKALAMTNHVIMRSFAPLQNLLQADGNHQGVESIAAAMHGETARIRHALNFLQQICTCSRRTWLSSSRNQVAGSLARSRQRPGSVHRC